MSVLDEKGRLFGRVNIVDAAVVVAVLGLVLAGGFLLLSSGQGNGGTDTANDQIQYATLVFGPLGEGVATQVSTNDTLQSSTGGGPLNVTDTQMVPAGDGKAYVYVSGRYAASEEPATASGKLRANTSITVESSVYRLSGNVLDVNTSSSTLRTTEKTVFVDSVVASSTASAVEAGDQFQLGNETVATIESVSVVPTDERGTQRLRFGATLTTLRVDGTPSFANHPVRLGTEIPFRTDKYSLNGSVENIGSATQRGTASDATLTIRLERASPPVVEELSAGMAETHAGASARITAVETEPSSVVVQTQDGNLVVRDHPNQVDITLTVDATVYQRNSELYFHGERLQSGSSVRLDFGAVTIDGRFVGTNITDEE